MSELQKRVATGFVGALILLLLIIQGGRIGISILSVAVSLLCLQEYLDMVLGLPDADEKKRVALGGTWLVAFANFWMPRAEFELLVLTFCGMFGYFLFVSTRYDAERFREHFMELVLLVFGMAYLAFLPLYFPLLHDGASGVHWTIVFLLTVWSGDTGAYFVGMKYGRRKLFPSISPKKTWEGAYGGVAASVVVCFLYKLIFFRGMSWASVIFVPVLVGAASQVGDLCESFLKRAFNRKDSGDRLPGHGGFLDRFDGVLLSLPVMYACIRILG